MLNLNKIIFFENFVKNLNKTKYLLFVFIVQIISIFLNYRFIFDHQGCARNINREFNLFGNQFNLNYPEMCDELFYFHGFQWINHIYENGYVYQDRPTYLVVGFIIYRVFFLISLLLNLQIDPMSLLLMTSFVIQLIVANLISYFLCKFLLNKFDHFYFLIFFLITFFSFEYRIYLFLPSSSTTYFLIFVYALYSIKTDKFNGLSYGILFTISGLGIIGFIYEVIRKTLDISKNFKLIIKNIFLFIIPTIFFQIIRLLLGIIQGPEYGVSYIHASEDYQQFVWFPKTIFLSDYEPIHKCHQLTEFISCYVDLTYSFFTMTSFYVGLSFLLLVFYILRFKKILNRDVSIILSFTFLNYLFILFQGFYQYRFIYYSIGFFTIIIFCYVLSKFNNEVISLISIILLTTYTLSRNRYEQFSLDLSIVEISLLIILIILFLREIYIQKSGNFPYNV